MLPSASALASRREERVQKAFSVDHHGPGDARLSQSAAGIYGESGDYVHEPTPAKPPARASTGAGGRQAQRRRAPAAQELPLASPAK